MMPGPGSRAQLSDKDLVESVLRELNEAADKWEALVGQAETVTYSVDLGDIHAVANSDGRLVDLSLHPTVMSGYTHGELADRLNIAVTALREEAEAENQARYGGTAEPCSDGYLALTRNRTKDIDRATQSVQPRPELGPPVLQPQAESRDHPVLGADEARRPQTASGSGAVDRLRADRHRLDGAAARHEAGRPGRASRRSSATATPARSTRRSTGGCTPRST